MELLGSQRDWSVHHINLLPFLAQPPDVTYHVKPLGTRGWIRVDYPEKNTREGVMMVTSHTPKSTLWTTDISIIVRDGSLTTTKRWEFYDDLYEFGRQNGFAPILMRDDESLTASVLLCPTETDMVLAAAFIAACHSEIRR